MTNTKIINAGVLLAAGSDLSNATKVTLPASTKKYTLEVIITNGAAPANAINTIYKPELRFATSNVDGVAATIAAQLQLHSQFRKADLKTHISAVTQFTTVPFVPTGSLLYVWLSHPGFPLDASVDVWLNTVDEAAGVAPAPPSAATKAVVSRAFVIPVAIATPLVIAPAATYVQQVTFYGMKAARVPNVGSVFVDTIAGNDLQVPELFPGDKFTLVAPPGKYIDLGDFYVDAATLNDGVFYSAQV